MPVRKLCRNFTAPILIVLLLLEGCAFRNNSTTGPTPYQRAVYFNKALADAALTITTAVPILVDTKTITEDEGRALMKFALTTASVSGNIAQLMQAKEQKDWLLIATQIANYLTQIPASNTLGAFISKVAKDEKTALVQNGVIAIISTVQVFQGALK